MAGLYRIRFSHIAKKVSPNFREIETQRDLLQHREGEVKSLGGLDPRRAWGHARKIGKSSGWELTIEYNNGRKAFTSGGSNSYPYNFQKLTELFGIEEDEEDPEEDE